MAEEIKYIIKAIVDNKSGDILTSSSKASQHEASHSDAVTKADKSVTNHCSETVVTTAKTGAAKNLPVNESKAPADFPADKPELPVKQTTADNSSPFAKTPTTKKQDSVIHSESLPSKKSQPVAEKEVELVEFVFNGYESGRTPSTFDNQPVSDDHADFRIISYKSAKEEQITTNVTFIEENKPTRLHAKTVTTRLTKIAAVLIVVFLIAVSYLLLQSHNLMAPSVKLADTIAKPIPSPVLNPIPSEQKTALVAVNKLPDSPAFPAFIPVDMHDKSFTAKNPGWERYLSKQTEYRVFSENGRVKAVQIIASKSNALPPSLVKAVLIELTGSDDYRINSRENKSGFQLVHGITAQNNDLLFYNKDTKLQAFVVTIN